MKQENYDLSYKKWNDKDGITAEFQKPGRVDWEKVNILLHLRCGHCVEAKDSDNGSCHRCPIYQRNLCYPGRRQPKNYFYLTDMALWRKAPRNKRTGRRIAERIFKAILKDDPKKGEKLC